MSSSTNRRRSSARVPVATQTPNETADSFVYRAVEDLEGMSLEEIERIWDLVPTEDRDFLQRRYRQKIKQSGVTDDQSEIKMIDAYLQRYVYEGLVPAGDQWLKINASLRQRYQEEDRDASEDADVDSGVPRSLVIAGAIFGIFLLIFLVGRITSRGGDAKAAVIGTPTPTPTVTVTPSPTRTPTPTPIPTITPIALVDSDEFIAASSRTNKNFFPVQFQIISPETPAPRVFVVQERQVKVSEWEFDNNPDVVSWISGTSIRPVIGIPFSPANKDLFSSLTAGSQFILRMNTGAELRFTFSNAYSVGRQDTSYFRQNEPGVVLVLIGEVDDKGLPTADRQIIYGSYNPSTEIDFSSAFGLPYRVGEEVNLANGLTVEAVNNYVLPAPVGVGDFIYAVVDLELSASEDTVSLTGYRWFLDVNEARYYPDLSITSGVNFPPIPSEIEPQSSVRASLGFLVSRFDGESLFSFAPLNQDFSTYLLTFNSPVPPATVEGLDLQIRRMTYDQSYVYVEARLFNPQTGEVVLGVDDISVIYGFTPSPTGPLTRPQDFKDLTFASQSAYDVTLRFPWNGDDPYAKLTFAGRVFDLNLVDMSQ